MGEGKAIWIISLDIWPSTRQGAGRWIRNEQHTQTLLTWWIIFMKPSIHLNECAREKLWIISFCLFYLFGLLYDDMEAERFFSLPCYLLSISFLIGLGHLKALAARRRWVCMAQSAAGHSLISRFLFGPSFSSNQALHSSTHKHIDTSSSSSSFEFITTRPRLPPFFLFPPIHSVDSMINPMFLMKKWSVTMDDEKQEMFFF